MGLSEQSVTPGFTIDTLCKALGVNRNYSFLPLYSTGKEIIVGMGADG